jgi:hypothetical protein
MKFVRPPSMMSLDLTIRNHRMSIPSPRRRNTAIAIWRIRKIYSPRKVQLKERREKSKKNRSDYRANREE